MLYALIFFPMAAAFAVWLTGRKNRRARNLLAAGTTVIELLLAVAVMLRPDMQTGIDGVVGLGIHFETDGFRKVYLVVIAFLWTMTMLLGNEYFSHYTTENRYYFFNLMTLGATMGVFLARDLFTALIFFEIMSFTSYTWVIQEETPAATKAANTYLAVAVIGGLATLMGLFLLQFTLGTTEICALYDAARACDNKAILYVAGGCVLFGFGAKAGMFPLHIWLPKAHPVAPAPASALLSGLLTKSGIFGVLAITCNLFRNDPAWGAVILALGTVTMLLGALLALFSIDLKRTLACSSVSQIGFILVGIGMLGILGEENALAARGALLHMLNHSLFKLVLFLCAAVVYMNLHALNLNDVRGFGRRKPVLMLAFLLGTLGIGGVPLLNGYVSKTLLHESIVEGIAATGAFALRAVEWIFLFSGGVTVAYMTKLFVALFVEAHPTKQAAFDAKRPYMNRISTAVLLLCALALPALGLSASVSMNALADLGTDFFRAGALEHAVHYLSWENLKGGLISIAIGVALYFGFVRTMLMKREGDVLFGENKLTAPLAKGMFRGASFLTGIFGENKASAPLAKGLFRGGLVLSHALSDLLDAFILLLRKTVYRESAPPVEDKARASIAYRLGRQIDRFEQRHGKEAQGSRRYAEGVYRARKTVRDTSHRLFGNLSFALLMLVAALCFVFFYMLILH